VGFRRFIVAGWPLGHFGYRSHEDDAGGELLGVLR